LVAEIATAVVSAFVALTIVPTVGAGSESITVPQSHVNTDSSYAELPYLESHYCSGNVAIGELVVTIEVGVVAPVSTVTPRVPVDCNHGLGGASRTEYPNIATTVLRNPAMKVASYRRSPT
jgi:hypothetical protein